MHEFRGGDRGDRDYMRSHSHGSSSVGGDHVKPKTPEEQAADRVSRFRSDAEQAATNANKLGNIVALDDWRAARASVEKRHGDLQRVLADREKDAALAEKSREDLDAAKAALSKAAETLKLAKEPRPKPPVSHELDMEPQLKRRSADPNDVLAWAASLGSGDRRRLGERLDEATSTSKSQDRDEFAIELANYLASARMLREFRGVLANPKRFNAAAYEKARAKQRATAPAQPATNTEHQGDAAEGVGAAARVHETSEADENTTTAASAPSVPMTTTFDAVHDPALAPNGPLSFTEEPSSIAVETSCYQDPATKDITELVKGVPITSPAGKQDRTTSKAHSPTALAHYLNIRSRDVWTFLREYLGSAVWRAPARLEWNELRFNAILIDELEAGNGELTEKRLRELLYPHDVFSAIAPHIIEPQEKDLPGAVKLILGQLFRATLGPSVARMAARYVDVADAMYAAAPTSAPVVRRDQLIAFAPIDRFVANALSSRVAQVAPDADILSGKRKPPRVALRPVQLTFIGAIDPALWFVVRAEPADATPEEVAASLFAYAQQGGEATSYYAYGIASAGALHALPVTWAVQFPEARQHAPKAVQDGALPEPTSDSIGARLAVIASTDSADSIALAQASNDPSAAKLSAAQIGDVFDECAIQLEHVRRGLVAWELADPIVGEIGYVLAKRNRLAELPKDQLGGWASIALGQRERLYRIATGLHALDDAAAKMGIADKRSSSAGPLREIVARYANAGATSHLASTSEQILAEAQRMQASLTLRSLQANVVELESAMENGRAVAGSDKQMREQAHAYLQTKDEARLLESKLLDGGEVSAEELERVQIQAQELAIQARLHTMQVQLDQLVGVWMSAGQGLIPTIVATRKFNDIGPVAFHIHQAIGEIYNDLNAEAKQVKPVNSQTGGTIETAQLDARRAALSRAQQRFAQLQEDRDLAHFFNDAYDAVKSQQLRTAIAHAAAAIGISIAAGAVAGWAARGLMAAEGVGAVTELSMGARVAVTATEVMGNAVGQTITSAGEEHATSFAGALVDNAAFVLAPKMLGPAEHEIHAAKAFEQMLESQLAKIGAQEARATAAMRALAKTGRVLSWSTHQAGNITAHTIMGMAMGAVVAKGHQLASGSPTAHASGGSALTQDLIIQGASVAIGKLVHSSVGERLAGLRQLAKRRDIAHTEQLLADALVLHELAAEVSVHPDAKLALELLHKRSALLEAELRMLDELAAREAAHPTQGGPSTREIAAMRADLKAQLGEVANQAMLDVQWRLLGLHELAPGVWRGTPEQTTAAIEEARVSGHHVEAAGDGAEVTRCVRIDGKDVELHTRSSRENAVHKTDQAHGSEQHTRAKQTTALPLTAEEASARKAAGESWTNKQVREHYNAQNAEIAALNEQWKQEGLTAEQRARKAHEIRHRMRMTGREMMSDGGLQLGLLIRDAQKYGDGEGPTFEMLVEQQREQGRTGDAAYEAIIASSQRTDRATNRRVNAGEDKPAPIALPPGVTVHGDRVALTGMNGEHFEARIKRSEGSEARTSRRPDGTFEVHIGKDVPADVALRQAAREIRNLAEAPRQRTNDLDQLYKDAGVAQQQLRVLTESIASELGGRAVVPESLKGRARAREKITSDYLEENARITDLARSSIELKNPKQIKEAMRMLADRAEVVRVKDRFAEPMDGYRDVMMNLRMPNGHIVELQLHLKAILDVKGGPGHALYEQKRKIEATAKAESRPLSAAETAERDRLAAEMQALYDHAYEDSQR